MLSLLGAAALFASVCLLFVVAHRIVLEHRATVRLGSSETGDWEGLAAETEAEGPGREERRAEGLGRGFRVAVPVAVGVTAAAVPFLFGLILPIACAIGFDAGVVAWLWLAARHRRHLERLEAQLAEALRLTAAALRAGLGRVDALQRAAEQVEAPLRPILLEAVGRLRLGEAPNDAFARLSQRVPLETFRLFAMIIATQWQAGGSLQGTLASVGDFMQDRVDVQQRITSQSAPTRSSTIVLFGATAAIAWLSWTNDPVNMQRFFESGMGTALVSTTLALQGVALVWMDRLMRSRV
ncbi:MAG: type II secretion system F family protein [Myxococcota bacterium]